MEVKGLGKMQSFVIKSFKLGVIVNVVMGVTVGILGLFGVVHLSF